MHKVAKSPSGAARGIVTVGHRNVQSAQRCVAFHGQSTPVATFAASYLNLQLPDRRRLLDLQKTWFEHGHLS